MIRWYIISSAIFLTSMLIFLTWWYSVSMSQCIQAGEVYDYALNTYGTLSDQFIRAEYMLDRLCI